MRTRSSAVLAAGFTNAGGLCGDKVNCLIDLALFAAQHSMIWVSQGLFYDDTGINRMGSWLGLQAQSDNRFSAWGFERQFRNERLVFVMSEELRANRDTECILCCWSGC